METIATTSTIKTAKKQLEFGRITYRTLLCVSIFILAATSTILLAIHTDYVRFHRDVSINGQIVQISTENGLSISLPKGLTETGREFDSVQETKNGPMLTSILVQINTKNPTTCGWLIGLILDSYGGILYDPSVDRSC